MLPRLPNRSTRRLTLAFLSSVLFFVLINHLNDATAPSPSIHHNRTYLQFTPNEGKNKSVVIRARHINNGVMDGDQSLPDPVPLERHRYRPDGLMEVNPNGAHPIFELIGNAEKEWEEKLTHASVTLGEAVAEYKHRYKRLPPVGFDDWWTYVEENNVQLPDEYDQIYRDLEPFWGMDPNDLQEIEREWEGHADSFTIGKTENSSIRLVNSSLPYQEKVSFDLTSGATQIKELLEDVEDFIPPFRAVFSPHDNPSLHTNWDLQEEALRHAAAGTFLDLNNPPEFKLNGWPAACHSASPAVRSPIDWDASAPTQATKTFIYKHREAMDPCLHPSLLLLHGQFLSHKKGPVPHQRMVPQFSYSPTMLHHDITVAMPINWVSDLPSSDNPAWEAKIEERLQWRGTNTGIWHARDIRWKDAQRTRLVEWATTGFGDNITVLPSTPDEKTRVGAPVPVKKTRYAPAMLDIAFSGSPGCAPEVCEELKEMFEWRKSHSFQAAGKYKYIIDVDGNGWSSRFKRLITSNSLIFKSTIYPEWFTDRIAPWVHYVPVQVDLSDLWDSLLFFRGDPSGQGTHDDMARKIGQAGRDWSLHFWRKEDLTAYLFRLFLEYARVMSPERLDMNYVHVDD